ncbi:putative O-glycosylation ligase, exosortase A system-associated [bacterium]|nr:putative O-glycosylation ligase, exosortase A system-associated [bacterium]
MKRLIIAVLLTFSGIIGSFINPFYGLLIYIWFAYIRAQEWAWGAGWFIAMRPSLLLAVSVILGAIMNGEKIFRKNKINFLLIALWFTFLISYMNAVNSRIAFSWIDFFTKLLILGFCMSGMINSKERLLKVVLVIVLSIGFYSGKCGLYGIIHPGAKISGAPGGIYIDNNTFALIFVMGLPMIFFIHDLITKPKYNLFKKFLRILFFLSILGIIFTYSRGGFLGLAVVILVINWRSKRKFTTIPLILIGGIIIAVFIVPDEYINRMKTITTPEEERDTSSSSRLYFWKIAVQMANDHPYTGVGMGCYPYAYDLYDETRGYYGTKRAVHSSYFQMLTNNGYIAFSLFLLLIYKSLRTCAKIRKKVKHRKNLKWVVSFANMFEISIIGYCVSGAFVSLAYCDLIYHLFILITSLEAIANSYLAMPISKTTKEKTQTRQHAIA